MSFRYCAIPTDQGVFVLDQTTGETRLMTAQGVTLISPPWHVHPTSTSAIQALSHPNLPSVTSPQPIPPIASSTPIPGTPPPPSILASPIQQSPTANVTPTSMTPSLAEIDLSHDADAL